MLSKPNKPELMAPAGSLEALSAAIKAGADSVYFGVGRLNMRARAAKFFTLADMKIITAACRKKKIKSYLALNTLVYDEELKQVKEICAAAKEADVTAVIASDWAAIRQARDTDLPVHISTQANVSNLEAVRYFARYAEAVVLARELTLDQIAAICREIQKQDIRGPGGNPVRIEVFVHGALCVSIAGKCYMSLALTNHSANRGDCLQTCRRGYRVIDEETGEELAIRNRYIMSPRDLCTIGILDKLVKAGPSIFKIEGRGRAPDYVYRVTKAYREAIDNITSNTFTGNKAREWQHALERVFNRKFWQNGYYLGHPLGEWADSYGSQAKDKKVYAGRIINYFRKKQVAEIIVEAGEIATGDTIIITGPTTGFAESRADSIFVNDKPVTKTVKGERATISFPEKVRPNDKVYILKPSDKPA